MREREGGERERVNGEFNLCELKLDHGYFIDQSSIDDKMKFSPIDRSMSEDQIGHSIMIAQPCLVRCLSISLSLRRSIFKSLSAP